MREKKSSIDRSNKSLTTLSFITKDMTDPLQSFDDYSLRELVDLLVAKTSELIAIHEQKTDSIDVQKLLLEIEQIQTAIKIKKPTGLN